MGFRDPLVVRREETEARAKAAPPPPGSLVHRLASWWIISISADVLFVLPVFLEGFEGWQSITYPSGPQRLSARFQQHFHLLIVLHAFRAFACTQVEIGLYCTVRCIQSFLFFVILYHHLETDQY